jgi:hypothetical protein
MCGWAVLLVRRAAAKALFPDTAAIVPFIFAAYFLTMDSFFGAGRTFGLMVFLGLFLALEEQRFFLLPIFPILSMLFYPAITVGIVGSCLFAPFFSREWFRPRRRKILFAAALAVAAAACLLIQRHSLLMRGVARNLASGTFEVQKLDQLVSSPVDTGKPWDIFFYFILNLNEHSDLYPIATWCLIALGAAGILVGRRRPGPLPKALPAMTCGFSAAFVLLYPLHPTSASRQTVFLVPLVLVFIAAWAVETLAKRNAQPVVSPRTAAAVAAAWFALMHPQYNQMFDFSRYRPLYEYFSALPKRVVTAGFVQSHFMDTLPVFASRTEYLSDMRVDLLTFVMGPQRFTAAREELLDALYSPDSRKAFALAKARRIDLMVVESAYYTGDFLAGIRSCKLRGCQTLAKILKSSSDPLGFYRFAQANAAFSWEDGGERVHGVDMRRAPRLAEP